MNHLQIRCVNLGPLPRAQSAKNLYFRAPGDPWQAKILRGKMKIAAIAL